MDTAKQILDLLKFHPRESIEYFSKIALGDSTMMKFGFDQTGLSINFFITGKPQKQKLCLSKKMQYIIESDNQTDFAPLNNYLPKVKNPVKFSFSPYLKINETPDIYAFRICIERKKD